MYILGRLGTNTIELYYVEDAMRSIEGIRVKRRRHVAPRQKQNASMLEDESLDDPIWREAKLL